MELIRFFAVSIFMTVIGIFEAFAQEESRVKVDPGVSVHNYKHPNKAAKARKMQEAVTRRFGSRVGIVRRSTNAPSLHVPHETPKYARRSGWIFFKRPTNNVTRLNPLTNPAHYKVNMAD